MYKIHPNDFVFKSFRDGGLTFDQLIFLYQSHIKRENLKLKIQASIHGIQIDDELVDSNISSQQTTVAKKQESNFLFRDPKDYEKMDTEERERLTKKMMQHYSSINFFKGGQ